MNPLARLPRRPLGIALIAAALVVNPWVVGMVATDDGTVAGFSTAFLVITTAMFVCLFGGLQLLLRWVEPLSWVRPVGLLRGSVFVLLAALVVAGPWWGINKFNRGHSHTIVIPSEIENASPEQKQWAEDFYQRSLKAALEHGWFDIDQALAQGFQQDRVNRTHYPNLQYMFDDVILDPERPEWLVYHDSPDGKVLMALMFFTTELLEEGPTPAGPIAPWHYHPYEKIRCAVKELWTVGDADSNGHCAEGEPVTRTPEMFHVWFIAHPLGRFTEMKIVPDYWQDTGFDIRWWHPVAVHFAIALFIISVLLDLAGTVARRPGLQQAAWVNLSLAAVAAIATVAAGMVAEVYSSPTPEGHQTLDVHKLLGFASLAMILLLFAWRYLQRGHFPRRGGLLYLLLGLTGAGLTSGAGYFGGEMVYQHATAVRGMNDFYRERYWREVREIYLPMQARGDIPERPGVY